MVVYADVQRSLGLAEGAIILTLGCYQRILGTNSRYKRWVQILVICLGVIFIIWSVDRTCDYDVWSASLSTIGKYMCRTLFDSSCLQARAQGRPAPPENYPVLDMGHLFHFSHPGSLTPTGS
eukprot:244865-Amorphochlora_amoeboformis.AAC.1